MGRLKIVPLSILHFFGPQQKDTAGGEEKEDANMQNNFFLANNALPNESRIVVKKEGILCCLHAVEEYGNLTVAGSKKGEEGREGFVISQGGT